MTTANNPAMVMTRPFTIPLAETGQQVALASEAIGP